jgi:hypothetical protein
MDTSQKNHLLSLQGILWSRNAHALDMDRDKTYIIHQVLMYGSLEDMQWLKTAYSLETVQDIFVRYPAKIYTPQAFRFIVKAFLHLPFYQKINEQCYLKTSPRYS